MATAFGGGQKKVLTVHVGKERTATRLIARVKIFGVPSLGVIQEPEGFAGRFVVWNADARGWQVVASVFHAFRQTWHILWKYGKDLSLGEKEKMLRAARLMRDLNLAVLGLGAGTSIAQMRQTSRYAIVAASKALGEPRKPSKQTARAQLAALSRGSDRRGRSNPSAAMARTITARDAMLVRLEQEILTIDPQIKRRQQALINIIQMAELIVSGVRGFLEELNTKRGFEQLFLPDVRRRAMQHCRYLALDLQRLDFEPYRRTCQETARDLRDAADILASPDELDDARAGELQELFSVCRNALALKEVQISIERLLFLVIRRGENERVERFPFARARAMLEQIITILEAVDESGFRTPVRDRAMVHVRAVSATFSGDDHLAALARAKEELKSASALL